MGVKQVQRTARDFKTQSYFNAIKDGVRTTLSQFTKNLSDMQQIPTMQYPEEQPNDITARYRGIHRLTHRSDESIACVACFMCATACPAQCIFIEATKRTDGTDEKMPQRFDIDMLECIFCGYCVEACPCDAIRMDSGIFTMAHATREEFVYTKEKLLSIKGAFSSEHSHAK